MKNKFLPLLIVIFINSSPLLAQDELIIRYGFKGGMNVSNTNTGIGNGPSYKDPKAKVGAAVGFLVHIPLNYRFSIQPELLYSNEGSRQNGLAPNAFSSDYTKLFVMRLNYVALPVMVQLHDEESGLYIEAGPQLNWIASAKLSSSIDVSNIVPFQPFKGYFNSRSLSASIGAGINLLNGIGFGIRYNMGVTRVTEDLGKMRSNSFYAGVHFKY